MGHAVDVYGPGQNAERWDDQEKDNPHDLH